jgi:hypothetical protein
MDTGHQQFDSLGSSAGVDDRSCVRCERRNLQQVSEITLKIHPMEQHRLRLVTIEPRRESKSCLVEVGGSLEHLLAVQLTRLHPAAIAVQISCCKMSKGTACRHRNTIEDTEQGVAEISVRNLTLSEWDRSRRCLPIALDEAAEVEIVAGENNLTPIPAASSHIQFQFVIEHRHLDPAHLVRIDLQDPLQ